MSAKRFDYIDYKVLDAMPKGAGMTDLQATYLYTEAVITTICRALELELVRDIEAYLARHADFDAYYERTRNHG